MISHQFGSLKEAPCNSIATDLSREYEKKSNVVITIFFKSTNENTLDAVVSQMCAYDGLQFKVFITSQDLRKAIHALGIGTLPTSVNSIRQIVISYCNEIKNFFIKELAEHKTNKRGFSLSFDEWTSVINHR